MKVNDFSFLIGGEAGAGITRSGSLFAKACMRGGLHVFGTNDYQSLIRGGHNFYVGRVGTEAVYSQADRLNLLVALNAETAMLHKDELVSGGGIIFDEADVALAAQKLDRTDLRLYSVPLRKIVVDELKEPHNLIMRNTVALGAAIAVIDYDFGLLEEILNETFKKEVAELNVKAAQVGYRYARERFGNDFEYKLAKTSVAGRRLIYLSGNEAVGLGALKAGCTFYASYPMTPTTGLLHFMAENERDYGLIVLQPEGEITVINMIAGAAFAGARAMTATSGGGFCLMSEGLGMAGMTETPIVVVVGQRPGPSTGLPTYSAQGDLRFVLHASQGEFPRVVVAPGDIEECFYETMWAFNWAEKYQLPVILLTDKYLAESEFSVEPFDVDRVKVERGDLATGEYVDPDEHKKYRFTENGVSPRMLPGTRGAVVRANADEHNEFGFTSENPEMTARMIDKRMRKLQYLAKELEERSIETVKVYGPEEAMATIVSWGGTKGPIREAMRLLAAEGVTVNFLQLVYMLPFPAARVKKILEKSKKTIAVEHNSTSQFSGLIREHLLKDVDHRILKYDGRPFNPGFLAERIKEVL